MGYLDEIWKTWMRKIERSKLNEIVAEFIYNKSVERNAIKFDEGR